MHITFFHWQKRNCSDVTVQRLALFFFFFHSYIPACQQFEVNIIFSNEQILYLFLVSICNVQKTHDNKLSQNIKILLLFKKNNQNKLSRKISKHTQSFLPFISAWQSLPKNRCLDAEQFIIDIQTWNIPELLCFLHLGPRKDASVIWNLSFLNHLSTAIKKSWGKKGQLNIYWNDGL